MQNQLTEFADAVNGAACKIFTDYGSAVDALNVVALVAPPVRPVAVALSLGQWAAERNCTWDQDQDGPAPLPPCSKGNGTTGNLLFYGGSYSDTGAFVGIARSIISEGFRDGYAFCNFVDSAGRDNYTQYNEPGVTLTTGRWCIQYSGVEPEPDPPPPPPAPYTHVTEEGCELTVNFEGWGQMPDGTAGPIFRIEPSEEQTRASGGIIGGCNFNPTIVYSPGGGGGDGGQPPGPIPVPYLPDPDDDGNPLWKKLLEAALAGAVSGLVQNLFDRTDAKLDQLLECACPEEEPIEGEFRTISFRSDETSPFGKSRLRKRLRYRSRSGIELGALVDHWKDFSWESGPVRVRHVGAAWGTPEVWASTESEGKRVLLHAAGEAGIDPNQVGRWSTRSSGSSRLGVSDTMRVDTTGGYYWITARDGSDQRPIVAFERSDN